jgi:hypothetical protein
MMDELGYPPEWIDGTIQARIRALANYTCEICGLGFIPVTNTALGALTEDGRPIFGHVHHLDHCPPNCADDNLIFLCQRCHIQLHGLGWKPGDELPLSWGNEPPPWLLRRKLPYRLNPVVATLDEAGRYAIRREDRTRLLIDLIEGQGWLPGVDEPLLEMRRFLTSVAERYRELLEERAQAAIQHTRAEADAWAAAHGFIAYEQAVKYSGLSDVEFQAALGRGLFTAEFCPYTHPSILDYFDPAKLRLDADTLAALRAKILVSRAQAADLLGVSVSIFERKRRQLGLRHAGSHQDDRGQREPLYRLNDVLKLRARD